MVLLRFTIYSYFPRYLAGQKEYEVELQFTSDVFADPDKIREAKDTLPKNPKQYMQGASTLSLRSADKLEAVHQEGTGLAYLQMWHGFIIERFSKDYQTVTVFVLILSLWI